MAKAKKKLKRFHRDIYFPDWFNESYGKFLNDMLSKGSLMFSVHAVDKIVGGSFEYGKQLFKYLLKSIKKESIHSTAPFEFYAVGQEIKKACLRFSFTEFPVDITLVIASDGTVITLYTTNRGDTHQTMNTSVYERR